LFCIRIRSNYIRFIDIYSVYVQDIDVGVGVVVDVDVGVDVDVIPGKKQPARGSTGESSPTPTPIPVPSSPVFAISRHPDDFDSDEALLPIEAFSKSMILQLKRMDSVQVKPSSPLQKSHDLDLDLGLDPSVDLDLDGLDVESTSETQSSSSLGGGSSISTSEPPPPLHSPSPSTILERADREQAFKLTERDRKRRERCALRQASDSEDSDGDGATARGIGGLCEDDEEDLDLHLQEAAYYMPTFQAPKLTIVPPSCLAVEGDGHESSSSNSFDSDDEGGGEEEGGGAFLHIGGAIGSGGGDVHAGIPRSTPKSVRPSLSPSFAQRLQGASLLSSSPLILKHSPGGGDNNPAEQYKDRGNKSFKEGDCHQALHWYTKAIAADPTQSAYFSNRSGVHVKLGFYSLALADANEAVKLEPEWAKAEMRRCTALQKMCKHRQALKSALRCEALRSVECISVVCISVVCISVLCISVLFISILFISVSVYSPHDRSVGNCVKFLRSCTIGRSGAENGGDPDGGDDGSDDDDSGSACSEVSDTGSLVKEKHHIKSASAALSLSSLDIKRSSSMSPSLRSPPGGEEPVSSFWGGSAAARRRKRRHPSGGARRRVGSGGGGHLEQRPVSFACLDLFLKCLANATRYLQNFDAVAAAGGLPSPTRHSLASPRTRASRLVSEVQMEGRLLGALEFVKVLFFLPSPSFTFLHLSSPFFIFLHRPSPSFIFLPSFTSLPSFTFLPSFPFLPSPLLPSPPFLHMPSSLHLSPLGMRAQALRMGGHGARRQWWLWW
jgi:tetratricopeptide (TPR) repeat protein